MIAVVERVSGAKVTVDGQTVGQIGTGLLVLIGVGQDDGPEDMEYIVRKTAGLRIFEKDGKMTLSVKDTGGELLAVSQFTLLGDGRKGNRPDFGRAAAAEKARAMFDGCVDAFRAQGLRTQTGEFGAHMLVHSEGDGPVTILLDSKRGF